MKNAVRTEGGRSSEYLSHLAACSRRLWCRLPPCTARFSSIARVWGCTLKVAGL